MVGMHSHPEEAELRLLCDRFNALHLEVQELDAGSKAIADDGAFEGAVVPLWEEQERLVDRICATAARTVEELHSKKVSLAVYRSDLPFEQPDRLETALAQSIAEDERIQSAEAFGLV